MTHGANRRAQQRRKVPRQRRHQQHARLGECAILPEMQQGSEGGRLHDLFADNNLAVLDPDGVDAVGGTFMRPSNRNV